MKTIQVPNFTWKTLTEIKLKEGKKSLGSVIDELILEHAANQKKEA